MFKKQDAPPQQQQQQPQPVQRLMVNPAFAVTTFSVPGHKIMQSLGVVRGLTVRNPNLGGGESSVYMEMAEKARETAMVRLLEHAAAKGGNAVIGIRYDTQEVMPGMTEVLAYGTAVVVAAVSLQALNPPVIRFV
ncbi:hypothetical protein HDU97_006673 [Phlyctochytrium planicorne]|nr:hypothetical protein HDU97_006673 [Phlyctochytrium planicorne]